MKIILLALLAGLFIAVPVSQSFAQDKSPVKFGKIEPQDFDLSGSKFDSGASAVIIADIGNSSFEGNTKGWFTLMFQRKKRIKIINKNGFGAATDEIHLYSSGRDEERLLNFKAYTYNLENGKVVQTKLDETSVFKEKLSKNVVRQKFTFPAVKEGSIIELTYTISSDFLFNLQPWTFQSEYPNLWSEYQVQMPDFFSYVLLSQGYLPFFINKKTSAFKGFNIMQPSDNPGSSSEHIAISSNLVNSRWVIKDVPALKEENFTSTLKNHVSKIDFQLAQYRFPQMPVKDIMGNWVSATDHLMKDEEFGLPLEKDNNWLSDDLRGIVKKNGSNMEKAKQIYAFVRDHFTCTSFSDLRLNNSLKTIFAKKNGSVADINLLLVAMLRHEGIQAYPVILSTKDHGYAFEMYPLMDRYNYVIVNTIINDTSFYLDATRKMGFGKLSSECYNGSARLISENPMPLSFVADSLKEEKITSVFMINSEKGEIVGEFNSQLGYNESDALRSKITKSGREEFAKKITGAFNGDVDITSLGIDSLADLDNKVKVHYEFTMNNMKEDVIYFNPMMAEGYRENIFKAAERYYPVEMPYAMKEVYLLNMEVPKGYVIDEIPKSAKVNFNEGEGFFEYSIFKVGNERIQLRSQFQLNKANFSPEDYAPLRDFFGYVVKKHSEQIVFKKAK
ncbi:MAG: transglutaminase domain-containing protein [Chitinophagaceae bacterium]